MALCRGKPASRIFEEKIKKFNECRLVDIVYVAFRNTHGRKSRRLSHIVSQVSWKIGSNIGLVNGDRG